MPEFSLLWEGSYIFCLPTKFDIPPGDPLLRAQFKSRSLARVILLNKMSRLKTQIYFTIGIWPNLDMTFFRGPLVSWSSTPLYLPFL